jgi:hypothetical protein
MDMNDYQNIPKIEIVQILDRQRLIPGDIEIKIE